MRARPRGNAEPARRGLAGDPTVGPDKKYFVKIDVLEARDYADRVPDVQLFFIRQSFVDFHVFYGNYKNHKKMHAFCKNMHDFCKNMHDFWKLYEE